MKKKKKRLRLSKCGHCFNCLFEIAIWKLEDIVVLWNIIQVPTVSEMVSYITHGRGGWKNASTLEGKGQKKCNEQIFDNYHGNK